MAAPERSIILADDTKLLLVHERISRNAATILGGMLSQAFWRSGAASVVNSNLCGVAVDYAVELENVTVNKQINYSLYE